MSTPSIAVIGAGAFGTALAMTQALDDRPVMLWGRNADTMQQIQATRENAAHLPGQPLPDALTATADLADAARAEVLLLAIPTQTLRGFLTEHAALIKDRVLVVCCKGVERGTGLLPTQIIEDVLPGAATAALTGPSFAADIGRGKPTALTLATTLDQGAYLQLLLSSSNLRVYLSDDPVGAQLGGALKNVIALAAGMVIGADLGESARAALMTRGFAEIVRLAATRGAHPETLWGLSGFGDLILTCSSEKSRNFSYGIQFARGQADLQGKTVEGVMTAHAVSESGLDLDLPVTHMVSALLQGTLTIEKAVERLLSRPLRSERQDG